MENLNAKQIIKALEYCNTAKRCIDCPYRESDCDTLYQNALALINSQEQRIKELTEENERGRAIPEQLHKEMSEQMVEEVKTAKKYTVLIMQAEINKTLSALCKGDVSEIYRIIDQIAKEMCWREHNDNT